MEAGNHPAACADLRATPDCGCGRTLLGQMAHPNQPVAHRIDAGCFSDNCGATTAMVNLRNVAGQDGTFARKSTQPFAVAYL
jgi:hypothetical protein